ncbi:MAG: hypothetical protein KGN35_02880 [Betaproteobacteria bacterium]|nr:hypothetical protein [Betaproteobacteria bacterium]
MTPSSAKVLGLSGLSTPNREEGKEEGEVDKHGNLHPLKQSVLYCCLTVICLKMPQQTPRFITDHTQQEVSKVEISPENKCRNTFPIQCDFIVRHAVKNSGHKETDAHSGDNKNIFNFHA